MATWEETLRELASKEDTVSTADLAKAVGSTESTLRSQLSKLSRKGYVEGSAKEGWLITTAGREALERGEKIPVTPEDVGADTKSKLDYYGKLAGVAPDLILGTSEIILTGDPEDLEHVWEAMTQMDIPLPNRRRWFNLWRNYLKQGIPPDLREKVIGSAEEIGEEGEISTATAKDKGRDYIIADDVPVYVGPGGGDFGLKDAKDIINMRALKYRFAGQAGGGTGQALGLKDIFEILDRIEKTGAQAKSEEKPKEFYVDPETGIIVKDSENGEYTLSEARSISQSLQKGMAGQGQPPPGYYVDDEGTLKELKPGQPIVVKKMVREQGKTYVINQQGELVEQEAGKPIIIQTGPPSGSNPPPMLPFPVLGEDGKPVYDQDGKPIYANLEPMMKWLTFQSDQKRSEERHGALMGLVKTVRENIGDGITALKVAAEEAKGSTGSKKTREQPQAFACADCGTEFSPPEGWEGQPVKCPNPACGREYSKEELLA